MDRFRAFWPPVLLVPLVVLVPLLLALPGCGQCGDNPGPDLDPTLLSANGLIYLNSSSSHSLYAIEMATGSIRWTYQASGTTFLDHDLLYINDANYTMKALDATTGTLLWQKDGRNGSSVSMLFAATDHLAYIAGDDGLLEAVNGRDGTVRWQHVLKVDPSASLTDDPAALLVTSGVVYLSTVNSSVYAFRERDGALLWQFNTTQGNSLNELTSTAFGDGMIFFSADQTYALRMSDGKLLWRSAEQGTLLEADGILYVNAYPAVDPANPTGPAGGVDRVFAFRANDGKQVWQAALAPKSSGAGLPTYGMQLLDQGLYIFPAAVPYGSSAELFALRASDGTPRWEDTLSGRKIALVVLRGTLYLSSGFDRFGGPGFLKALRETDGAVLWSRSLQQVGVVVTDTAIYAGSAGNTDSPCAPVSSAQLDQLQVSDGTLIWHRQLDPVPDRVLFTKSVLAILGGLLSLLGLLVWFVSRTRQPKDQWPSPLLKGTELAIPMASVPRIKRMGWLLVFIPGILLLLVAAALAAQGGS